MPSFLFRLLLLGLPVVCFTACSLILDGPHYRAGMDGGRDAARDGRPPSDGSGDAVGEDVSFADASTDDLGNDVEVPDAFDASDVADDVPMDVLPDILPDVVPGEPLIVRFTNDSGFGPVRALFAEIGGASATIAMLTPVACVGGIMSTGLTYQCVFPGLVPHGARLRLGFAYVTTYPTVATDWVCSTSSCTVGVAQYSVIYGGIGVTPDGIVNMPDPRGTIIKVIYLARLP